MKLRNIFKKTHTNFRFGDHNPPCTCHGPAEDMKEIQIMWGGDVDWGTSVSDCAHKNFPCEYCGADIGDSFKEGFTGILSVESLPTGDWCNG